MGIHSHYFGITLRENVDRLTSNHGLNAEVPWLSNTDSIKCFICKNDIEGVGHFVFGFRENFTILWSDLKTTFLNASSLASNLMFSF